MNLCPLVWSALLVLSLMPASASAECLTPSARTLDEPTIALVFGGYVVSITQVAELGVRVTFNVERVWKGSVPKRLDLYIWRREVRESTIRVWCGLHRVRQTDDGACASGSRCDGPHCAGVRTDCLWCAGLPPG